MSEKVMVTTRYRKCGCIYEEAGGVLLRRTYCKEHPAEGIESPDNRPPLVKFEDTDETK